MNIKGFFINKNIIIAHMIFKNYKFKLKSYIN